MLIVAAVTAVAPFSTGAPDVASLHGNNERYAGRDPTQHERLHKEDEYQYKQHQSAADGRQVEGGELKVTLAEVVMKWIMRWTAMVMVMKMLEIDRETATTMRMGRGRRGMTTGGAGGRKW